MRGSLWQCQHMSLLEALVSLLYNPCGCLVVHGIGEKVWNHMSWYYPRELLDGTSSSSTGSTFIIIHLRRIPRHNKSKSSDDDWCERRPRRLVGPVVVVVEVVPCGPCFDPKLPFVVTMNLLVYPLRAFVLPWHDISWTTMTTTCRQKRTESRIGGTKIHPNDWNH